MLMLDRLSSLIVALTIFVIGLVIALMINGDVATILTLGLAGLLAVAILFRAQPHNAAGDPPPPILAAPPPTPDTLLRHPDFGRWADQEKEPLFGTDDNIVVFANDAAIRLFGRHIMGAEIRTAIRHPAAIDWLSQSDEVIAGQAVNLIDFPRSGQRWTMRIAALSGQKRIIFLSDRSAIDAVERMRSDFVANASHELRTPLAAILGYVETLGEMVGDDSDPKTQSRFLAIIEREARRMQQLVSDLLSVSRVEADRFRRPTDTIDLSAVVNQTIAQLRESEQGRAQDIVTDFDAGPHLILGDAVQLTQLVHNILSNAMKYGTPGSPVTARLVTRGRRIELAVRDVGDGIEPDHLPRLTERFYRVDEARSRSVGGTGLGLAIVKHISERHQGQLDISSEVGRGTTVSVTFPALSEDTLKAG